MEIFADFFLEDGVIPVDVGVGLEGLVTDDELKQFLLYLLLQYAIFLYFLS
jgi:hypothetical protein